MNNYLNILKQKAKKIGANIEPCGFDKDCIKEVLALKVRSNLEDEDLQTLKNKAISLKAPFEQSDQKEQLLNSIQQRVKEILEEENERFTSLELQQNFLAADLF